MTDRPCLEPVLGVSCRLVKHRLCQRIPHSAVKRRNRGDVRQVHSTDRMFSDLPRVCTAAAHAPAAPQEHVASMLLCHGKLQKENVTKLFFFFGFFCCSVGNKKRNIKEAFLTAAWNWGFMHC